MFKKTIVSLVIGTALTLAVPMIQLVSSPPVGLALADGCIPIFQTCPDNPHGPHS